MHNLKLHLPTITISWRNWFCAFSPGDRDHLFQFVNMSFPRTPPRSLMMSEAGGGSTSNLSNYEEDEAMVNKNPRKRRPHTLEYDFKRDLAEFRGEIMTFIKEAMNAQIENITEMRNEIRQDIQNLKSTTESLALDYKKLHESVENISAENKRTQNKITLIENELHMLQNEKEKEEKSLQHQTKQQEILNEIKDRIQREKNVIMVGLQEKDENCLGNQNDELEEVYKILKNILQDCTMPLKLVRLGKYNTERTRALKITFDCADIVRCLLKNRFKLHKSIKIFSDQTPAQREYMQKLQAELKHREQIGETNLTIKYNKGVPAIIKNDRTPKN